MKLNLIINNSKRLYDLNFTATSDVNDTEEIVHIKIELYNKTILK